MDNVWAAGRAPTSNVQVYARWAKYGSGGTLTYNGARAYVENAKGASWSQAAGNGTGATLDITTAQATGPIRINSLTAMSSASTLDFQFIIHDGTNARDLATVSIASTWSGFAANINLLAHTNFAPFVGTDLAGNKYLELPANWKLQAYPDTTVSAGGAVQITTRWSNYGY